MHQKGDANRMKNETLDLLARRRSVRAYEKTPVRQEDISAMQQAVLRAPTAGNMMLYSVIDIQEPSIKASLADLCDHQSFIAEAPLLWLFAADCQKWDDYYHSSGAVEEAQALGRPYRAPGAGDLMIAACDTMIAAQTAVTAADSLSIGSCYIGDILENYEQVRELLKLPKYVFPLTLVCFGYPKGGYRRTEATTIRHEVKDIFHTDQYQQKDGQRLSKMFAAHDAAYAASGRLGAENRTTAHYYYLRKYTSTFMLEMNRSVAKMLKNWA